MARKRARNGGTKLGSDTTSFSTALSLPGRSGFLNGALGRFSEVRVGGQEIVP
jgi:hypothetical protein